MLLVRAVEDALADRGITRPCSREARLLQELALACQKRFRAVRSGWPASRAPGASVEWLELTVASCRADVILAGTRPMFPLICIC
jgi:hypothetical protein